MTQAEEQPDLSEREESFHGAELEAAMSPVEVPPLCQVRTPHGRHGTCGGVIDLGVIDLADGQMIEATPRARVIAAIHAYAEWLAEHPEIPAPTMIDASLHVHDGTFEQRKEAVVRFARANDIQAREHSGGGGSATLLVMAANAHGVEITHRVQTHGPDTRDPWS